MNKQAGLVKLIVIVVIGVLILSYFRVDIRNLLEDKLTRENLTYLWGLIQKLWSYLTPLIEKISQILTKQ